MASIWTSLFDWGENVNPLALTAVRLNQLIGKNSVNSGNLQYLLNRPQFAISRDNNADYTTTSTTFVDIDGTNLAGTLITSGSAILMGFTGMVLGVDASSGPYFDFSIDGTRLGSAGAGGIVRVGSSSAVTAYPVLASIIGLKPGLSAGSHTIKIQWKVISGTGTLYSGVAGVAATDFIPQFWAVEVG